MKEKLNEAQLDAVSGGITDEELAEILEKEQHKFDSIIEEAEAKAVMAEVAGMGKVVKIAEIKK